MKEATAEPQRIAPTLPKADDIKGFGDVAKQFRTAHETVVAELKKDATERFGKADGKYFMIVTKPHKVERRAGTVEEKIDIRGRVTAEVLKAMEEARRKGLPEPSTIPKKATIESTSYYAYFVGRGYEIWDASLKEDIPTPPKAQIYEVEDSYVIAVEDKRVDRRPHGRKVTYRGGGIPLGVAEAVKTPGDESPRYPGGLPIGLLDKKDLAFLKGLDSLPSRPLNRSRLPDGRHLVVLLDETKAPSDLNGHAREPIYEKGVDVSDAIERTFYFDLRMSSGSRYDATMLAQRETVEKSMAAIADKDDQPQAVADTMNGIAESLGEAERVMKTGDALRATGIANARAVK